MLPLRIAAELLRLTRDRLPSRSSVPRDLRSVTAAWLSGVLGSRVDAIERIDSTVGTTQRARFRLEGDGAPGSVFVKLAPRAPATRAFVNMMALGLNEVGFYRRIRPGLPIEAPGVHATAADPSLGRFVLVLEDLAARGCRFADVRETPTLDQAQAVVTALARLHAHFWESPRFAADLTWVTAHAGDPNAKLVGGLLRVALRRLARAHPDLVPRGAIMFVDRRDEIESALGAGPVTLLHGDPHFGNLYFDGDVPGFLDWQVVRRGSGLRDLAYFVVLSLDEALRTANERDLLGRYLEELRARGAVAPTFDAAWERYRVEAFYPWTAAAFTAGMGGFQAAEIATAGLRRATAALGDLDTVRAVERRLER